MTLVLSLVVGVLFAGATYLMLRRSVVKLLLGLVLLSHGTNLLLFLMGDGVVRGSPPFVDAATGVTPAGTADPLPQALILTAIVISFGFTAFIMALAYRANQVMQSDDLDDMTSTDKL
jgi:multicomponent Na+:H+ antiporter subunit C